MTGPFLGPSFFGFGAFFNRPSSAVTGYLERQKIKLCSSVGRVAVSGKLQGMATCRCTSLKHPNHGIASANLATEADGYLGREHAARGGSRTSAIHVDRQSAGPVSGGRAGDDYCVRLWGSHVETRHVRQP
jgi:hypothetical protein